MQKKSPDLERSIPVTSVFPIGKHRKTLLEEIAILVSIEVTKKAVYF